MLSTQASSETSAPDSPCENSVSRIDDATSEIERLTRELELILKKRNPAFGDKRPEKRQRKTALSDQEEHAAEPAFTWRSPDQAQQPCAGDSSLSASEADLASTTPAVNTMQWLRAARRDRRWALARSTAAWGITVVVSGMIIAAATYMMLGGMPVMSALAARLGS